MLLAIQFANPLNLKAMFAKKIKTTETYILPEEFDYYTKLGYVIFMAKPNMFGTYRALKIEVIPEPRIQSTKNIPQNSKPSVKLINPINKLINSFLQHA
jgi:hypothetical protein